MPKSKIVGHIASLFYPFCLVFGLYVVLHGHLTPGGGFQGGAVMATGVALMMVSGRFDAVLRERKTGRFKWLESIGLLSFALLAFGGLLHGGAFFHNFLASTGGVFGHPVAPGPNPGDLCTAGLIPLMNLAVGVEVLGGISLILVHMIRAMKDNESAS